MTHELKPCPFCGGEAIFKVVANKSSHSGIGFCFEIACKECRIAPFKNYYVELSQNKNGDIEITKDERQCAVDEWNRRTTNA